MRRAVRSAVMVGAMAGVLTGVALGMATRVHAVEAKTVLEKLGLPSDTMQRVLAGEFVETSLETASERDLNVAVVFVVKTSPESLEKRLREEEILEKVDPNQMAWGDLEGDGTAAQFAALKLTPSQLESYGAAAPGDDLNLSAEEIAALEAARGNPATLQDRVRELLLARYRAYRTRGLAGIAAYVRDGSTIDPAADLARVNRNARGSKVLPTDFYDLLDNYPKGAPADLKQRFYWSQFKAHGADTISLVHAYDARFAGDLIAVQRHFYVSTGYNCEQAIAGFLPVQQGTLVIYTNHTSTDQVAGFGGGAKRSIGRKFMASQLEQLFEKTRGAAVR